MEQFPRDLLAEWAARQPELRALGIFGGRATGTANPDSNLDIWIELVASDEDRLTVFDDNRLRWTRELTNLTGLAVNEIELRGVSGSVVGGVEVFRRADQEGRMSPALKHAGLQAVLAAISEKDQAPHAEDSRRSTSGIPILKLENRATG